MKPHIYFDGDKWNFELRTSTGISAVLKMRAYCRALNERRAMQYFTAR
jgi:hypothetical protein